MHHLTTVYVIDSMRVNFDLAMHRSLSLVVAWHHMVRQTITKHLVDRALLLELLLEVLEDKERVSICVRLLMAV